MRTSKLQLKIIESLNTPDEYDFLKKSVNELIDETGAIQQSIDRSLKTMMSRGLVGREKKIGYLNFNDWEYKYFLAENESKNIANEERLKIDKENAEIEARSKGYESASDMFIKTRFQQG